MSFQDLRLSVSEASKLFGVSQQTIRRAINANKLKYIIVRGRYRLSFSSVLAWSQQSTSTKNKLENQGMGQFVDHWKIKNRLYSPNPENIKNQLK